MDTELENWKSSGKYFIYRDHKIFFKDEGQGATLLLIHGYPTSSYDWHKVWSTFTKHYRVIALDMIGMGFSDKPKSYAYDIMDHTNLHELLVSQLGIKSFHLLAHDLGVGVAQEMVARRLESQTLAIIESVTLMNGCLFPEVYRPRLIQHVLCSPLGALIAPIIPKGAFKRAMLEMFGAETKPSDHELEVFWQVVNFNQGRTVTHLLSRSIQARAQYRDRFVAALINSSTPLQLVNGANDPNSGKHMADRYSEIIPNPHVLHLQGIGHWPQLEVPDAVFNAVHQFMANHLDKV